MSDEARLWRRLMDSYEKDVRPVKNSSKPVTVSVTFNLLQLEGLVSTPSGGDFFSLRRRPLSQRLQCALAAVFFLFSRRCQTPATKYCASAGTRLFLFSLRVELIVGTPHTGLNLSQCREPRPAQLAPPYPLLPCPPHKSTAPPAPPTLPHPPHSVE